MKPAFQRVVLVLTASTVWFTGGWGLGQQWSSGGGARYGNYQQPVRATDPYGVSADSLAVDGDGGMSAISSGSATTSDTIILPPENLSPRPAPLCDEQTGLGYCCPPQFYISTGAQVLARNRPRSKVLGRLILENGLMTNRLSTRTENFDASAGLDMTVGKYLGRDAENRDRFAEFTFWGLHQFEMEARDTTDLAGPTDTETNIAYSGALYSGFFTPVLESFPDDILPGFDAVDEQYTTYKADLNNFELNLRFEPRSRPDRLELQPNGRWQRHRQEGWFWSYSAGVRYLDLDEDFEFDGRGTATITRASGNTLTRPTRGIYSIFSQNDFVGGQVGGELFYRVNRLQWGVRTCVCPGVNFAETNSLITNHNPFGDDIWVSREASHTNVALYGDVSLIAEYVLVPRWVLRAEYDFMFLTGFALAAEQVDFRLNAPNDLNANGYIFAQGLTLALERRF